MSLLGSRVLIEQLTCPTSLNRMIRIICMYMSIVFRPVVLPANVRRPPPFSTEYHQLVYLHVFVFGQLQTRTLNYV